MYLAGNTPTFFELRGKMRDDHMPDEWIDLAVDVWCEMTRKSERKKDSLRHPRNHSDETWYRVHFQECRDEDVLEEIIVRGKQQFGNQFHFSTWYTAQVKPFFVKPAKRENCLCVYCLRFQLLVEGNYNFHKSLRQHRLCHCTFSYMKNAHEFRNMYICPKPDGSKYYQTGCRTNTCQNCQN